MKEISDKGGIPFNSGCVRVRFYYIYSFPFKFQNPQITFCPCLTAIFKGLDGSHVGCHCGRTRENSGALLHEEVEPGWRMAYTLAGSARADAVSQN
jgi:hypothetical protein